MTEAGCCCARCRIERMRKQSEEAAAERGGLGEALSEARERLAAEQQARAAAAEKLEGTQREVEIMRVELTAARQNMDKAEWEKSKVGRAALLRQASRPTCLPVQAAWHPFPVEWLRCWAALLASMRCAAACSLLCGCVRLSRCQASCMRLAHDRWWSMLCWPAGSITKLHVG